MLLSNSFCSGSLKKKIYSYSRASLLFLILPWFPFFQSDCDAEGLMPPDMSGYFRLQAGAGFPEDNDFRSVIGDRSSLIDKAADFRLVSEWFPADRVKLEVHYEAAVSGGDTRKIITFLDKKFPGSADYFSSDIPSDRTRIFNLTHLLKEENEIALYHRLDRLSLTYSGQGLSLGLGRHAMTWGHGLIFNPVDIFNPFSPTSLIRDYKTGDDMVSLGYSISEQRDLQMLWVPRRSIETGNVTQDESSLATRFQLRSGWLDMDLMASRHRGDSVIALGGVGYLGESAMRADLMLNLAESDPERASFLTGVVNIDRSWVWLDRNFYGLLEFYANGAGTTDYANALNDPWISSRIRSGEIYLFGPSYLGASLRIELHPLLNVSMTGMFNIEDKSCFFQPQLAMDASSSLKINIAADLPNGESDTEFGGIPVPGTGSYISLPLRIYSWVTYWF